MPEAIDYLKQFKEDPSALEKEIQQDQERLETEPDPRWRTSLAVSIASRHRLLGLLPTLDFRFPNQTFEGKLVFHGTLRMVELLTLSNGHTPSDAYLVLPAENIMFMGDLGFFGCQPFMAHCDPQVWTAQLEKMEESNIETFVPGHGPLGTKAEVALQRQYIAALEELVAQVIKDDGSIEEVMRGSLPAPFDAWLNDGMARFEANVWSSYERLSGE
jgi:glyoxylase-like metal-dependent hydrolase (beta-lactamase superfamily II)